MYFIIYSSKVIQNISEDELRSILESSKKNNETNGITGLLILYKDTFIQMLEGKESDVRDTFERIKQDSRHDSVITVFSGVTHKRHFPNWKMALEVLNESVFRKIDAYESLSEGDSFLNEVQDDHIGLKMLSFFYDQKKNA